MLDMTLKELYETARIDGATLDIRFDFPRIGEIAFVWFKDGRRYGRVFSRIQLEAMRFPTEALKYERQKAVMEIDK